MTGFHMTKTSVTLFNQQPVFIIGKINLNE